MFQLTHGEACSLDHSISMSRIGIYCVTMYGPEDCPMGPSIASMDSSSSLQFSVAADRFCSGQRALRINDAITILNYTMSRQYNRSDVHSPLRTFQMNDMIYFLLSINTAKSLRVLSMQVLAFRTKFSSMGIYVQPGEAAARMLETFDEEGHALGWDTATQTHAMRMQLNQYFVQNAAGDPLLLVSPGGKSPPVFVQLTFLVAYENIRNRRRSRPAALSDQPSEAFPRVDQSAGAFSPVGQSPGVFRPVHEATSPRARAAYPWDLRDVTLTHAVDDVAYGQAAVGTSLRVDSTGGQVQSDSGPFGDVRTSDFASEGSKSDDMAVNGLAAMAALAAVMTLLY
jgi:hypothetical protein